MARPPGSRNEGYEERRNALAASVVPHLLDQGPGEVSLRGLARAADASLSTLRHYFGDRTGVIRAALEAIHRQSVPYIRHAATPQGGTPREELLRYVRGLATAWRRFDVGRMHALGLGEGFRAPEVGISYVQELLEPAVDSAERLLASLEEQGDIAITDRRTAALALIGPVVLALLHQDQLHGVRCRPLDVDAFLEHHVEGFVHGHV